MNDKIPELFEIFSEQSIEGDVYDCYDGDTFKMIVTIPSTDIKVRVTCRMEGYDSPEVRTRNKNEKKLGIFARDRLREKILNKKINAKCGKADKYGRLLVRVTVDDIDINNYMIDNNLGHPYGGGTKSKVTYNDDGTFMREGVTFLVKAD